MTTAEKLTLFSLKSSIKIASLISSQWGASIAFNIFCTPYRKPRNVPPPIFQQATAFDVQVDGLTIYGYRWNPNALKKILILHGFESRAYNFDRYIAPLLKKGYGVVAMDGKAHGNSEGKTTTAPEYAEMIRVLEQKLGKFDGFISHSFGGIALCLYQETHSNPAAKMVLAPGRFSTITCCPHCSVSFCPTRRPRMSLGPPGAKGTISFIGLAGNCCACAKPPEANINTEQPRYNDDANVFIKYP